MKPLKVNLKMIQPNIVFCPNEEIYTIAMNKFKGLDNSFYTINRGAVTTVLTRPESGLNLIIGIKTFDNIYEAKALIVHELSHAVTEIMNYYGFICDEFRSYCLQSMYIDVMSYYDKYLEESKKR